jgi:Flp pilus assembly protein TadG
MAIRKPKAESGQSIVEFAICALILLMLVFAIIDFSYLFYAKLTLQNAVRQGGRYAITGQAISGKSRYLSILTTVQNFSMGMATSSNTTVCGQILGCQCGGGPGETVTVNVTYPYKFITPFIARVFTNGTYTVTVSSSFKNEQFPPSSTY